LSIGTHISIKVPIYGENFSMQLIKHQSRTTIERDLSKLKGEILGFSTVDR